MPFSTTPYCTLTQVKAALDLQKTSDDGWLGELIEEAQALLDKKIGYSFQFDGSLSSPVTRFYDGSGLGQLLIDPCISLVEVLEVANFVSSPFPSSSTQNITNDCYLAPLNTTPQYLLKRLSGQPFIQGNRNYQVKGVFGFQSIPPDITRACIRLTTHFYKMRDTNYSDLLAEQGAVRTRYVKEIPLDVMEIIDLYKRRKFICQ